MNILVIDDEVLVLEMLQKVLNRWDFHVDIAQSGAQGISKFDSGNYDLVITDIRMPGVDGHMVVHHIKASKREFTPVIGLSGTPWELCDGSFDDILDKPFNLEALVEKAKVLTCSRFA